MTCARPSVRCGGQTVSLAATWVLAFCAAAHPRIAFAPRILVALGDGYWRLNQRDGALEVWREGLMALPDQQTFRIRLDARPDQIPDIIERALDAGVRVDTTLRELFPDLPRAAWKAIP
jgi:hypothetical protein